MKRSRFTAHTTHPTYGDERKVILAYDPFSVREHYQRMGYTVHGVERGDHRRKARAAETRSQMVPYRIDRAALQQAIDFLGITMPVVIKQTTRVGSQSGVHSFQPASGKFFVNPAYDTASGGMVHVIRLKDYIGAERASEAAWHELAHAMQAERACKALPAPYDERDQFDAWAACKEKGVYRESKIEREARSYEQYAKEVRIAV